MLCGLRDDFFDALAQQFRVFLLGMPRLLRALICCPITPVCREGSTELAIKKNYPYKDVKTAVDHCTVQTAQTAVAEIRDDRGTLFETTLFQAVHTSHKIRC